MCRFFQLGNPSAQIGDQRCAHRIHVVDILSIHNEYISYRYVLQK